MCVRRRESPRSGWLCTKPPRSLLPVVVLDRLRLGRLGVDLEQRLGLLGTRLGSFAARRIHLTLWEGLCGGRGGWRRVRRGPQTWGCVRRRVYRTPDPTRRDPGCVPGLSTNRAPTFGSPL